MVRRLTLLLCLAVPLVPAQELAHRGWRGNGIAPEAWFRHATFVRFGSESTFAGVAASLDDLGAIGADTLILPDLLTDAPVVPVAGVAAAAPQRPSQPYVERFGSEEQLDGLLREASARRMHVLLRLPLARVQANPGELRFWMSRGVAGVDVGAVTQADAEALRTLRSALDRYPGQRILLAHDAASPVGGRSVAGGDPVTLHVLSAQQAESVQAGMGKASGSPQGSLRVLVEVDAAQGTSGTESPGTPAASAVTAMGEVENLRSFLPLLLAPGQPILDSRMLDTPAKRSALQQVMTVRNAQPAFLSGTVTTLGQPAGSAVGLRAWLVQARRGSRRGSLLIAENAGSGAETLHMAGPLTAAGLHATYLRPVLRSDGAMGPLSVESGRLPAGAAVVGEIGSDVTSAAPAGATDLDAPPTRGARPHSRRRHPRR